MCMINQLVQLKKYKHGMRFAMSSIINIVFTFQSYDILAIHENLKRNIKKDSLILNMCSQPSAMDLAQEIEQAQTVQTRVLESRKHSAKKRGEDAVLREKVRRDYQTLMQHLDQLTNEERKLKASQVEHYPVYILF